MTKLARLDFAGTERIGVLRGDCYIDPTQSYAAMIRAAGLPAAEARSTELIPADLTAILAGGQETLGAIADAVAFAEALPAEEARDAGILLPKSATRTLVPIPKPPKIVCVARNYRDHAEEAGLPVSEIPILFPRFANTQIADGQPIIVPTVSRQVDWEGELAVIVGRGGRHIAEGDAMAHIGGYTICNDVSVRDYQFRVTQYTAGKNFSSSAPIGPTVTLTDEGIDPHRLQLTTKVNGVVKQHANTAELLFSIPRLIAHISEFIDLEPGDIIPTGTPAGVGFKRNPPEFLTAGDTVEVSISGLGVLSNPVEAEQPRHVERNSNG